MKLSTAMSDPHMPAVIDFSAVFGEAYASHQTPAGLVETLMPDVSKTSWLLITSNSLVGATESTTLTMVLERAIPHGVAIALDVAWHPESWGLEPGSRPTPEVLRRFHPLAQEATLIRCTPEEADQFFSSDDPLAIHGALSQRPGVVITGIDGSVRWCIGGRLGTMETKMLNEQESFFSALIESFAEKPELLGNTGEGPGTDAVADSDRLKDALLSAASK
ncbi:fructokinase [Synechococcus sp. EJ6-Ellesmere]|uniref:fructokinase n=1 Tax=Synechococcus sp. EJ6-Ellesmere TaxID=2823734 RepID=UPI0020CFD860|nr:fructokinase [Synechococcus sp. EJ6-Ellesmere]MCP9825760.1 fructokinase [Synechococcus sp. EJ6-Ellesmere]